MANLQKTLDSLQPFVIGIRYLEGITVVDTHFKEGWALPESNMVKSHRNSETENLFTIFSDKKGVGLDELLKYVESTIKANKEREEKSLLFKKKVSELRDIFKSNTLQKLQQIKFSFEDLISPEEDFTEELMTVAQQPAPEQILPVEDETNLSEEEREILAEERRGAAFLQAKGHKVELPRTVATSKEVNEYGCMCNENEACSNCIDKKDF